MKHIVTLLLCLGGMLSAFSQVSYLVSNQLQEEDYLKPKVFNVEESNVISFSLLGGLIMVDSEIDGKQSNCIFDTGAPSIIINKNNNSIENPDLVGVGVNGTMNIKSKVVKRFKMGKIKRNNVQGMEVDISHLEKLKKQSINGILGVGAYDEEEVLIDYEKSEIQFLPRKHKSHFENKEIISTVPFFIEDQLPVIKVKIGKKTFYFGVDTGAEMNVINTNSLNKLKKCKTSEGDIVSIAGVNPGENIVKSILVDELKIKKQTFDDQKFVVLDLKSFNRTNGYKIDGILGFPFLKENLISFDFRRSKLKFWKKYYFEHEGEIENFVEVKMD